MYHSMNVLTYNNMTEIKLPHEGESERILLLGFAFYAAGNEACAGNPDIFDANRDGGLVQ